MSQNLRNKNNRQHLYLRDHLKGMSYEEIAVEWRISSREVEHLMNRNLPYIRPGVKTISEAAELLRGCGLPERDMVEILAIVFSDPDSQNVLDVSAAIAEMYGESEPL